MNKFIAQILYKEVSEVTMLDRLNVGYVMYRNILSAKLTSPRVGGRYHPHITIARTVITGELDATISLEANSLYSYYQADREDINHAIKRLNFKVPYRCTDPDEIKISKLMECYAHHYHHSEATLNFRTPVERFFWQP